ncbi:alpha-amylase family protein [Lacihabitans soyangensis]|uniref:Glycosyl hydrolase-like 10 domain-containing protein n=1 Tax=Lacihabitans soyangensis TaxID=869394 RepID=A0AAE3H0J1_9BACT|nr:alpha-amylase family protein [Lacihabitans soyangensis]MCP9762643.1 hypothetical protein [Lacihabitans soyangensis]
MPIKISVLVVFSFLFLSNTFAQDEWWKRNNLRVIQLNLPDYEAKTIQPNEIVEDLLKYSANTLIINAGGIMAFYPSKLENHFINPYMRPGVLGEIVEKCHQNNIKVMVRFDFSRADKTIFDKHPDWFYISPKGERMINTDKYVVSINAPYMQEEAFKIIMEVIEMFPIDGIFQNMPGYQTRNPYENLYQGIDQNEYDKKAFYAYSGLSLPLVENKEDSVFRKYEEFKKHTSEAWQEKLYHLVKAKNKNIAICTYAEKFVDIIRHESQSNSLPYWPYSASDNVGNAGNSYPDHIISNSSIQQISFQGRYNAVEPEEVEIRLWENIANGSGLDMSMMGDMRGYEDERNFEVYKKVYGFHKANEKFYGKYQSLAKIALIAPGAWPSGNKMQEYRGLMLMLKEAHLQFDIIEDSQIERHAERLKKYKIVIFPDITYLSENAIKLLQNVSRDGVNLIATNNSFSDNAQALKSLFGAEIIKKEWDGTGNYLKIDNQKLFGRLKGQSMIHWKFNLAQYDFEKTNTNHLPVLAKGRPGPPELIGGHDPMGYFGMSVKDFGTSKNVILPLNLGKLYYLNGYEQNKNLFLDVLQSLDSQVFEEFKTNAHPRVEMILKEFKYNTKNNKKATDGKILHFINLTGFSGNTFFEPLPVQQIQVSLKTEKTPKKAFYLSNKKPISFSIRQDEISFTVDKLANYEAVVFEY